MAEGKATRSTALQPLLWTLAAIITGVCVMVWRGADTWLLIAFASAGGLCLLVLLSVYVFFAIRDPDALRSEKFVIRKMEIEQSSIGDSERGVLAASTTRRVLSVVPPAQEGVDA